MGESITEGTIINWLVNEGERFAEGDIILEVATDKVDNEVPAPISGILTKTLFQAKDVVPVGKVIAILEQSNIVPCSLCQDKNDALAWFWHEKEQEIMSLFDCTLAELLQRQQRAQNVVTYYI